MSSFSKLEGHGRPRFSRATHLGTSKPELERDSGFSDASSEYLSAVDLTDSEDVGRTVSIIGQEQTGPQVAVMGGSYPGLSPMIIMNNFVLKQPNPMTPVDKQWGFPSPLEMMPQPQVVLLQPVISSGNSSTPKTVPENHRQSRNYLPILKSYPRIAPHPGEAPTKRQASSRVRSSSTSGYDQRQRRHHHAHRLYSSPSSQQQALQTPIKPASSFEAASSQAQAADCQPPCPLQLNDKPHSLGTETGSLPSCPHELRLVLDGNRQDPNKQQDALCMDNDKLKRFSNTYNILNKSGLLGITLRTKQLIKENRRTQGQLQQLQEQTALLMEALSSGDPQLWTKLQLTLQDTDKEQWGIKPPSVLA
ncbi:CLOCK-interacting pacemaker a [Myripristis murdjan]|uniref:CLOCK-interacting pacemaker a n=1 Tax=Myripristis murdjan TaxID=586833 RepID=A0A667Y394_9TELE|nr:CLOCK-interacting pacemaker [Myripristis murdjan]